MRGLWAAGLGHAAGPCSLPPCWSPAGRPLPPHSPGNRLPGYEASCAGPPGRVHAGIQDAAGTRLKTPAGLGLPASRGWLCGGQGAGVLCCLWEGSGAGTPSPWLSPASPARLAWAQCGLPSAVSARDVSSEPLPAVRARSPHSKGRPDPTERSRGQAGATPPGVTCLGEPSRGEKGRVRPGRWGASSVSSPLSGAKALLFSTGGFRAADPAPRAEWGEPRRAPCGVLGGFPRVFGRGRPLGGSQRHSACCFWPFLVARGRDPACTISGRSPSPEGLGPGTARFSALL